MSYILDALRRAEADRERERGQVPGLHTQTPAGSPAAPAAGRRRWLPWAGGGLLLLAGIGAGSWWAGSPPDAVAPSPQAANPQATPAPIAQPAAPPLAAPTPQPAASSSPYLAPAPPPVVATVAPPAPSPAAEAPIPRLSDLPEGTRRDLPKLVISGSVYSDDPASRFVIVNGEVQREGAKLGADLVLEHIGPRELVLRFRGQRYRQPV
jgi:general secretion pathway protein B